MKKLIVLVTLMMSFSGFSQKLTKDAYLEKWQNSKTYLLDIAMAMPEEKYDFKPTEREMSFAEQLLHIKGNMDWLTTTYFTSEKYESKKDETKYTKAQIISMLEQSFNTVSQIIKSTKPNQLKGKVTFREVKKTKIQILNLLQDHVTHHRGQIIVYLNLNQIVPPKYTGW